MKSPKIFELLRSLSDKERRKLDSFVASGYATNVKSCRDFHFALMKLQPDFQPVTGFKIKIYKEVFPGEGFHEKKFRYLLSDYTKLVEDFLAMESFRRDESLRESLLRKELALRDCGKSYKLKRARTSNSKSVDADYYLEQYQQAYIHLDHWLSKQKRKEEQNIEEVVQNLDRFYFIRKLQLSCSIQNMRNVVARDYRNDFASDILEFTGRKEFHDVPLVAVYHRILRTLTQEEASADFSELRKLLLKHESSFTQQQLREMYQYAMNFCIRKVNKGNTDFLKTLFDIYKLILPKKILLLDGQLPQFDYKNIVTLALRLKEIDWTRNFIEEYKTFLPRQERENAYAYNLAHWHFHRKEYSQTRTLFRKVAFTDIYYELDMRSILLKTYFEQDDVETFFYHASAFRAFIRRNKLVSDYQRMLYRNFILFAGRLIRAYGDSRKIQLVRIELEEKRSSTNIGDVRWLLEKAGAPAEN